MNFRPGDIEYLRLGSERQKEAYKAIQEIGLFEKLAAYSPILAGTLPLDIDVESSDLDIICCASDLAEFAANVTEYFKSLPKFSCHEHLIRGEPTQIAGFSSGGFDFELFAQAVPVQKQYAVLHLKIEARLLALGGEATKTEIRKLKESGLKTEPAFARYFKIEGDPYEELAKMSDFTEHELKEFVDSGLRFKV